MALCAIYFRLRNNADCISRRHVKDHQARLELRERKCAAKKKKVFFSYKISLTTNDHYLSKSVGF